MPAPKGNRFGVDSENFKKPKAYPTVGDWANVFLQYLEEMNDKVWNKKEAIKSGENAGTLIDIPTSTPLSIRSFCVFANIHLDTFLNYESKEGYEEYFDITKRMRTVIQSNQIEGATVGAYNSNIIARLVGLSEKKEHKHEGLNLGKAFEKNYE